MQNHRDKSEKTLAVQLLQNISSLISLLAALAVCVGWSGVQIVIITAGFLKTYDTLLLYLRAPIRQNFTWFPSWSLEIMKIPGCYTRCWGDLN